MRVRLVLPSEVLAAECSVFSENAHDVLYIDNNNGFPSVIVQRSMQTASLDSTADGISSGEHLFEDFHSLEWRARSISRRCHQRRSSHSDYALTVANHLLVMHSGVGSHRSRQRVNTRQNTPSCLFMLKRKNERGEGIHYSAVLSPVMTGKHGLHIVCVFSPRIEIRLDYFLAFSRSETQTNKNSSIKSKYSCSLSLSVARRTRRPHSSHTLERLVLADG